MTELSEYPTEWLTRRAAQNGMDITHDGKVWINADYYGDRDDYGVAASDLIKAAGRYRKAWVRGYHLRNADVPYRESKQLVHVDCVEERWSTELTVYYDPDGRPLRQAGRTAYSPAVPGSHAANWVRMICED